MSQPIATGTVTPARSFEDRFAAAPIVVVRGGIDGPGAAGGSRGGDHWDVIVHFAAWRLADGPMRTEPPMRLYYAVPKADLSRWMSTLRPYAVWQVRAAVLYEPVNGKVQARITEFVGAEPNDAELTAEADRLQRPVTADDPQLGRLTLDRRYDQFRAEVGWCGHTVQLTVEAEAGGSTASVSAVAAARSLLADATGWQRRINDFAVARLLQLRNDTWREDDEPALTEAEFVARMRLQSIAVAADGGFDFWHDDGGLFWGHAIQVSGTVVDGPTNADIPG